MVYTILSFTAAFASIANSGTYTEPILYTEILDHDGNVLIDNTTPSTHEAIKDSTAYLLTSAMEDVVSSGYRIRRRPEQYDDSRKDRFYR